jgi:glycosyltransferase involved in cell wall biosynthesis
MKLAVVTSGFPRRSETFVLNELLALEAHGLLGPIFATKPGDGSRLQPGAERLLSRVHVLPPASPSDQARLVAAALAHARVRAIHAYFAHTPAEVAREAALLLGVPYGFSVHARDARKVTPGELRNRAEAAACVVACNADVAGEVGLAGVEAQLLPHGVDLLRFRPAKEPEGAPLTVLAVGRLVPKKGFDVLVDAAAMLRRPLRLRVVGDGPERGELAARIAASGLADRVTLVGPLTHDELPAAYAAAHVVAVPSVRDASGDRDGLPNVVLEALASGRAVVASDVAAIATAVRHEVTGLLVAPGDAAALAAAVNRLAADSALRRRLAGGGRALVERSFALDACTHRLARVLEAAYA